MAFKEMKDDYGKHLELKKLVAAVMPVERRGKRIMGGMISTFFQA